MQRRVRIVFERIARESGGGRWERVDAGAERDEVERVIWEHVVQLEGGVEGPVRRLWEEHLLTS